MPRPELIPLLLLLPSVTARVHLRHGVHICLYLMRNSYGRTTCRVPVPRAGASVA